MPLRRLRFAFVSVAKMTQIIEEEKSCWDRVRTGDGALMFGWGKE
jgi:hypothetical protein